MGELLEQLAQRNLDAQFLSKLTGEAILESLARLAFAAGELPQARQVAALQALSNKKFLLMENQPGSDVDGLSGQCSCR